MGCEELGVSGSDRLVSPSAQRNKAPIAEVLAQVVPARGIVLEIASGTGQHAVHFARAMPTRTWQPSEHDPDCLRSIAAWRASEKLANLRAPLHLDVNAWPWPIESAAALVCINLIHIAPWSVAEALFRGAEALLSAGGALCLYGPFRRQGRRTAPSNLAFDAQLRAQNPDWGVRDLEEVARLADGTGFDLLGTYAMPSDNSSVVFRRREPVGG